jgi:filamentous hemagglutinin family protein
MKLSLLFWLAGGFPLWLLPLTAAQAQVVSDGTLNTQVQINPFSNTFTITGGTQNLTGTNLFHSFDRFSVPANFTAYFNNVAQIQNILSRVTGTSISEINGIIRANGTANLFLLNPNGIIFGPGARLNVGGSFFASTASSIPFADGAQFAANPAQPVPLLTVSVPIGLGLGTRPNNPITHVGNLSVAAGRSLTLFGTTVTQAGSLTAPGGTVQVLGDQITLLGSSRVNVSGPTGGGAVRVGGGFQGEGTIPTALQTTIAPGATINADAISTGNGGRIVVRSDGVTNFAGNLTARGGAITGTGGAAEIAGSQNLLFRGTTDLSGRIGLGTLSMSATNLTIGTSPTATLSEAALVGAAQTANVSLRATNNLTVEDLPDDDLNLLGRGTIEFLADADRNGVGSFILQDPLSDAIRTNGRPFTLSSPSLALGAIDTSPAPGVIGLGGGVTLTATAGGVQTGNMTTQGGSIAISGTSLNLGNLNTAAVIRGQRVGGDVTLTATSGNVQAGSITMAAGLNGRQTLPPNQTFPPISGGRLTVQATGGVTLGPIAGRSADILANQTVNLSAVDVSAANYFPDDRILSVRSTQGNIQVGEITAAAVFFPVDAGTVFLDAPQGSVTTGNIETFAFITGSYSGSGGNIGINAEQGITTGGINAASGGGAGGNIVLTNLQGNITTGNLSVSGLNQGPGGNVAIATSNGNITTGYIDVNTWRDVGYPEVDAGAILLTAGGTTGNITTGALSAQSVAAGGGQRSSLRGNAGEIIIDASGSFSPIAGASINTQTDTAGSGGIIRITAGDIRLNQNSLISNSSASGPAGEVSLTATRGSISLTNSTISALTSGAGNAGTVSLFAPNGPISIANNSAITTLSGSDANGTAGQIDILANEFQLTGNSRLAANSNSPNVPGGQIFVAATDRVFIQGSSVTSESVFPGAQDGIINITATSAQGVVELDNARLTTANSGGGFAGVIAIDASDRIEIKNRSQLSANGFLGLMLIGTGAQIMSPTRELIIDSNSQLTTTNANINGSNRSGEIVLQAIDLIDIRNGVAIDSTTSGKGGANGGNVSLETFNSTNGTITLSSGAKVRSDSEGDGTAGSLSIITGQFTILDGAEATVSSKGAGDGGSIFVTANTVGLNNQAQLKAETNEGIGGNITLQGLNTLSVENSLISTTTQAGTAGTIAVNATESVTLSGKLTSGAGGLVAEAKDGGDAGNLTIATQTLTIANGAEATVNSTGSGNAGFIDVTAKAVVLNNQSQLRAETDRDDGGDITLRNLDTLKVNNSLISTSTQSGQAGNITVDAAESVTLNGRLTNGAGGLIAEAIRGGDAGNLTIATQRLTIENGAEATVSSTDGGDAGAINVTANAVVLNHQAQLKAETEDGVGNDITLRNLTTLNVNNSLISTTTASGRAGDITVNAAESVRLDGPGGLRARATNGGDAGDIEITTPELTVLNNAQATVSSAGGNGEAGDLTVKARSIRLDSNGELSADTDAGRGGNIQLGGINAAQHLETVTLLNGGEISTSTGAGTGGTIAVNANQLGLDRGKITSTSTGTGKAGAIRLTLQGNLISTNGSEIQASSAKGRAGRIDITANTVELTGSSPIISNMFIGDASDGIISITSQKFIALEDSDILAIARFGNAGTIVFDDTPGGFIADRFARVTHRPGEGIDPYRHNGRVDISASSTVQIPDTSFLQNALSNLQSDLVSPDQLVAGSCIARRNQEQGTFVVTGTGGLPTSPYEAIERRYQVAQVQALPGAVATRPPVFEPTGWKRGDPIQEAQGMMKTTDGRILIGTTEQMVAVANAQDLICHFDRQSRH